MRQLVTVVASAALCASLMGLSLAWLTMGIEEEPLAAQRATAARVIASGLTQRLELEQGRMGALCAHDVRIERLALERAGLEGAALDASRAATSLANSHGASFWIVASQANAHTMIGRSPGAPALSLADVLVRRVSEQPVWWEAPELYALFACKRGAGREALWIVHGLRAKELVPELPGKVAWSAAVGGTANVDGELEVLRVPAFEGGELSLRWWPPSARHRGLLTRSLAAIVLAGLFGGIAAWLLTRSAQREELVLRELERAAARVAGGDLSSTIGLRVGGRADQTFQSFDRMTLELKEMRARLAEAERAAAFQDIAQRIAHEIKNPLSPIRMAMETLRKAHQKRLASFDEIFEESTRAVLDEVLRLERIVREFSEFARLPKPRPGALSLSALVEDVIALYRPVDVEVVVEAAGELPSVRADREQITQVLVNLLQNAFDAARTAPSPRVVVRLARDGEQLTLHVDDNGPGVARTDRERIFEPYVTTKPQGTGLGLAIVKRIVSDHGATIALTESPLGGARFSVSFAAVARVGA